MKRIIYFILLGVIITVIYYTGGIFYAETHFLLLPVMLILFLIGILGLVTVPLGLYRIFKEQTIGKWLKRFVGLAIGFYLGLLFQIPIDNWDEKNRNYSGEILSAKIEQYKEKNGQYPDSLEQLNVDQLNKLLPKTYQTERFTYLVRDGEYDLDIHIPILDRWHWEKTRREFLMQ